MEMTVGPRLAGITRASTLEAEIKMSLLMQQRHRDRKKFFESNIRVTNSEM